MSKNGWCVKKFTALAQCVEPTFYTQFCVPNNISLIDAFFVGKKSRIFCDETTCQTKMFTIQIHKNVIFVLLDFDSEINKYFPSCLLLFSNTTGVPIRKKNVRFIPRTLEKHE